MTVEIFSPSFAADGAGEEEAYFVLARTNRVERLERVGMERSSGVFYASNVAQAPEMILSSLQCNYILMTETVGK